MGQTVFVFSGQGDQRPGMGQDLYEAGGAARDVYGLCDRLRPGTSEQCFSAPEEELTRPDVAQPCLFAMELAAAETLRARGIVPDMAAGFSLGEVAACTFAGAVSLEDGFRLVCRRGALMQAEADRHDTFMAAVLKLEPEQVRAVCAGLENVWPVNFNCPGQITVSGDAGQAEALSEAVKQAGGRVIPLKVAGAFHSPYMTPAAEAFRAELAQAAFQEPAVQVWSDVTALPYEERAGVSAEHPGWPHGVFTDLLARQIESPVRWEELIRNMIARGADRFIEIGPGKTLTNMIRKIDRSVTAMTYAEALEEENHE